FGLARKRKEFFIAARIVLADGGKGLVFVAEEKDFSPRPLWFLFHPGNAVQHSPLKILLHKSPNRLGQPRIGRDREVERAHGALFDQSGKRWKRLAVASICIGDRIIGFLRRTEDALYSGVVIKER